MATQLQIRRGTSSQVAAFTGAEGEVVVNTTNDSIHVNDGSTAGGFEMARVDGSNWAITNNISTTANISFGDNDKAIFGAGSDLEIFHEPNNSIIKESGGGSLLIQGDNIRLQKVDGTENMLTAVNDGQLKLFYDGSEKLATTSTGIDVTGTVTADGLTVDSTTGFSWLPVSTAGAKVGAIGTGTGLIINTPSVNASFGSGLAIDGSYASDLSSVNVKAFGPKFSSYGSELNLFTSNDTSLLKRQTIASNGDISFYEDTGTTPKLFWDASAESLGIGTSSPSEKLTIAGDVQIGESSGGEKLKFVGASSKYNFLVGKQVNVDNALEITPSTAAGGNTFSTPAVVVNSSGNVGIGTSSPYGALTVDTANGILNIANGNTSGGTKIQAWGATPSNGYLAIEGYDKEYARFDSSGNVLVGTTSDNVANQSGTTQGVRIAGAQNIQVASTGIAAYFNRLSTDGDIVEFRRAGTAVGSIGTVDADLTVFSKASGHKGLRFGSGYLAPTNNAGTIEDAAVDLGISSHRFKDLHLSGVMYSGTARIGTTTTNSGATVNIKAASNGIQVVFQNSSGTTIGYIGNVSDSSTIYATSSDYRLKENVVAMTGATDRLKQLNPTRFNFIADADVTVDGFLAHEVQDVVPEAITGTKDAVDDDGNAVYQGIDQSKLVPLLVATIQELEARITQLENN
jgi:hypothetical protein